VYLCKYLNVPRGRLSGAGSWGFLVVGLSHRVAPIGAQPNLFGLGAVAWFATRAMPPATSMWLEGGLPRGCFHVAAFLS